MQAVLVIIWLKIGATLEAAMISLARWAPSVLSLFCHHRCITPPPLISLPQVKLRFPLHALGLLLCRRQQHLRSLHLCLVAATMCLSLTLCLRILHKHCHSLGSRIKSPVVLVLLLVSHLVLMVMAGRGSASASSISGVIKDVCRWLVKCCLMKKERRWWLLCRLFGWLI